MDGLLVEDLHSTANPSSPECVDTWFVPKRFLKLLGSNAAYVLAKLCWRQQAANNKDDPKVTRDKKQWFFPTLEEMHTWFPWLSTTALYSIINTLEKRKFIEVGRGYNRMRSKSDHTLWYHVPKKYVEQWQYRKDEQFFFATDLCRFKRNHVAKAIVLSLFCRELHLIGKGEQISINLPRNKFAKETGLPLSSISDMIREFIAMKLIAGSGEYYSLLIDNPFAKTGLKARGEFRKKLCHVTAVEASCFSNPHAVAITSQPGSKLPALVAAVALDMEHRAKVKTEKLRRKRKRGKGKRIKVDDSDWVCWPRSRRVNWKESHAHGFTIYMDEMGEDKPVIRLRNAASAPYGRKWPKAKRVEDDIGVAA
jgi:hypothetical protein